MSASIHDTTWRPRGSVWLVAGAATLAPFMEILDTTIVNVSLPYIAGTLSASNDDATWTLTSYLVANEGLVPSTLPRAIVGFLGEPQRLLAVEREFSAVDPVLARTALFDLLHRGRVSAPELHAEPLSLLTSFAASEGTS